jgi:hypothetical protein
VHAVLPIVLVDCAWVCVPSSMAREPENIARDIGQV